MAGLGLSLGAGLGSPRAGGGGTAPVVSPNLLAWTEAFDNVAWVKSVCTVDATGAMSPIGDETADEIISSGPASIRQLSATAATSGVDATAAITITPGWARYSVVGVFDALSFAFSIYIKKVIGGGSALRLRIGRSGGFLQCSVEDSAGLGDYLAWGAQLEQAATAGTYFSRTS